MDNACAPWQLGPATVGGFARAYHGAYQDATVSFALTVAAGFGSQLGAGVAF